MDVPMDGGLDEWMDGWTNNATDLVTCNLNTFLQNVTNTFCEVSQIFTGNCNPTVIDITCTMSIERCK